MNTVYIGNLNYNINEKQLNGIFSRYGKVQSVNLLTIPGTAKSKGIAFVKMKNKEMAQKAVTELDATLLDGRTVKVSIAKDNFEEAKKEKKKIDHVKLDTEKEIAKELIVQKKKQRRRRGLSELFANTGRA